MPIARNRKNSSVDPDAIAAFGAAAELRPEAAEPPASTTPAKQRSTPSTPRAAEKAPPASSLVRWAGEEELRDRLIAYSRAERHKMQDLMIKAMQIGLNQLEQRYHTLAVASTKGGPMAHRSIRDVIDAWRGRWAAARMVDVARDQDFDAGFGAGMLDLMNGVGLR